MSSIRDLFIRGFSLNNSLTFLSASAIILLYLELLTVSKSQSTSSSCMFGKAFISVAAKSWRFVTSIHGSCLTHIHHVFSLYLSRSITATRFTDPSWFFFTITTASSHISPVCSLVKISVLTSGISIDILTRESAIDGNIFGACIFIVYICSSRSQNGLSSHSCCIILKSLSTCDGSSQNALATVLIEFFAITLPLNEGLLNKSWWALTETLTVFFHKSFCTWLRSS